MRRVWQTAAFCALFLSLGASRADAQIWRWIYELSGPGPFRGWELERRLLCLTEPDRNAGPAPAPSPGRERAARALEILGPGCFGNPEAEGRRRRASFNLAVGIFDAERNALTYERPGQDRDVKLTTLEPSFWWRPIDAIEVGTGAGVLWFSGPAFASFRRGFLEPLRLDVKPLALAADLAGRRHPAWTELLSLRAGVIVIPNAFRAEDFGAVPGSFQVSREVLRNFSVFIDFDPLAVQLRRPRGGGAAAQQRR
jgi:hypothetical protein